MASEEALALIREHAQFRRLFITFHAQQRMDERNGTRQDIYQAIKQLTTAIQTGKKPGKFQAEIWTEMSWI